MAKTHYRTLSEALPRTLSEIPTATTPPVTERPGAIGRPDCPYCRGLGFVVKDVEVGHPDFGRAVPCVCAEPRVQASRRRKMNALGHLEQLEEMTFARFRPEGVALSPERQLTLQAAYDTTRHFADHPEGWLLLSGGYGVGKTHLAAAIANQITEQGGEVVFILAPDLLDHLRSTFSPDSTESYDELFDRVKNAPLLVLDDLGAESATPWAQEKFYQLLNHRYLRRLPTVITTNQPLGAIEPRIRSRLQDRHLVIHIPIIASDYRGGGHVDRLVELSELDLHARQTFDTFEVPRSGARRNALLGSRNAAWDYAQRLNGWIAFLGKPGAGKTHLAAAIANHVRQFEPEVLFISIPALMDYLRGAFGQRSGLSYDVRFEQIKQAPLLVLDDFRVSSGTTWVAEKLLQLVDFRYLTHKPTVFTLATEDKTLRELEGVEPRIAARLKDEHLCLLCLVEASVERPRARQGKLADASGEMPY